ncbi:MAG: lysylphosphatidylglycerol synthase transmembrane domain-containing protein [Candidatus Nanopelagicales bacterium]
MPSPSDAVASPSGQLDKKKSLILGAVGLFFIVIIFWKVIPQIGSYSDAIDAIKAMSIAAIVLVVVMVLVYLTCYGFPFMAATPGLKFWPSEQINQAAFAISNGVPGGGAVGLAFQFGMLKSYAITPAASTSAITAVGIWSIFISLGFPILGVVALVIGGENGSSYVWAALLGLAILVGAIVGFALVMRSEPMAIWFGKVGNKLIGPFRGRIKALAKIDLVAPLTSFRSSMYDVLKRRWSRLTAAQVGVSVTQFLILYVALRGIQGWDKPGTSVLLVFAAFAISQLGMMIPITPGGLGTVDAVMISLLINFGVEPGDATAADLVWRAASYVPQIAIGIVSLVVWMRRAGRTFATTAAPSA